MECGVPFCHNGCPLGNLIPDWNDLVYRDRWREAIEQLHRTNNFPEFTGRLCPAPCEAACVLEIHEGDAVTIKQIELAIVEPRVGRGLDRAAAGRAPQTGRTRRRRRRRARPGSPARSSSRAPAHAVTRVRARRGGRRARALRRAGVQDREAARRAPRRAARAEGVEFRFGVDVGVDVDAEELRASHDAVVLATGSRVPRDLPVPGRELAGVHFAMEYLYDRARAIAGGGDRAASARRASTWS